MFSLFCTLRLLRPGTNSDEKRSIFAGISEFEMFEVLVTQTLMCTYSPMFAEIKLV